MAENRRILIRADTAANWASNNPVLGLAELAYATDTGLMKIGDGSSTYSALASYVTPSAGLVQIAGTQTVTGAKTFNANVTMASGATLLIADVLQILKQGSDAMLKEVGGGAIVLETNGPDIILRSNDGTTKTMLRATKDAGVALHYNAIKRAESTNTGFTVTGEVVADTVGGNMRATAAESRAGTSTTKLMTPEQAKVAILAIAGWQPYTGTTGIFYDFAVNGAASQIETPEFEDGWEYMVLLNSLSSNATSRPRVRVYRATSAAWGGYANLANAGGDQIAANLWFLEHVWSLPRLAKNLHTAVGSVYSGPSVLVNVDGAASDVAHTQVQFVHATAQKIGKVEYSFNAGTIDAGTARLLRRPAYI